MKTIASIIAGVLLVGGPVGAQDLAELMAKGDASDVRFEADEALTYYLPAEKLAPEDADLLVKIARQYIYRMGELGSVTAKIESGKKGLEYAERAVKMDPRNSDAHLAISICLGKIVQLQGTRNWDVMWHALVEFAEKHNLSRVQMDLNMPWLHEGYHAEWQKSALPEKSQRWSLRFPLVLDGEGFGSLEFIGKQQETETLLALAQLTELLDAMHSQFEAFGRDYKENSTTPTLPDEESTRRPWIRKQLENLVFRLNSSEAVTKGVTEAVEIP